MDPEKGINIIKKKPNVNNNINPDLIKVNGFIMSVEF